MEQLENHKLDPNGQEKIPGTNTQNSPEDHSYSREVEKKTQKSRVTCQPMVLKAAQVLQFSLALPNISFSELTPIEFEPHTLQVNI